MINTLILYIGIIINVALITLSERKILAILQRRIGPNQVGYLGLLQPFADGIKLVFKETIIPINTKHQLIYIFIPYLFFYLTLLNWFILPLDHELIITELIGGGLLIMIAISELTIYGVLLSGWSSNSKYSLLGSIRSTIQMISYSINLNILILMMIFSIGSINYLDFMYRQTGFTLFLPLLPISLLFLICIVAENSRAPFDLPEAESELVSGFMTEYSGIYFAFFFLAEYTNMIFLSTLFMILFFGISNSYFILFIFIWLRASLPRIRFDQLLYLGWIYMLPLTISFIILQPILLLTFDFI